MDEMIRSLLVRVCGTEDALDESIDLIDSGILDSLAFIELLTELDFEGISIQPTQVDRNRFRNINSIIELVKEYQ
ncbi:MAG: D-alanine--poly(phosphoribitol) ligase subunit 2 [Oscillospiraceae bacterium]|nr:D-alanine--poly(phosphoribitol) ligase subunit 2 [Oscillospiraceae bacterium]